MDIPHCRYYNENGCSLCEPGYAVDKNGYCSPKNCLKSSSFNYTRCDECMMGYELNNGLCYVKNCQVFSSNVWSCTLCFGRFENYDEKCRTKNCLVFSSDNYTCSQCEQSYELKDGACLLKNCKGPTDFFCEECLFGYKFNAQR